MLDLVVISFCLCCGMAIGHLYRYSKAIHVFFSRLAMVTIYFLLFTLGTGLGRDEKIFSQIPTIGLASLAIALSSSVISVVFILFIQPFYPRGKTKVFPKGSSFGPFLSTIKLFICFALAFICSRFAIFPEWIYGEKHAGYLLWVTIFSVGITLGADLSFFSLVRKKIGIFLAIPTVIILGTIAGSALVGVFFPGVTVKDAIIAGCGLSYYTMSSLLVGESGNTHLAAITLLSNILRELLGIMGAPFLAKYLGNLSPVAFSAAAAMDTSLPVISQYTDESTTIAAVFSGMVITVAVPLLLTFLLYA